MNLLAKIRIFGALCLSLILFNSCEESGVFGINSEDVAPVNFLTESNTIPSTVVALDSVISRNIGRMMVGELNNPRFGIVTASSYMAVSLNTVSLPDLSQDAVLDSAFFSFSISYLFDTTEDNRDLSMRLYQIGEEFKDTLYINSSSLINSGTIIGEGAVNIERLDSTYQIPLDATWANTVINGIKNDEESYTNQLAFSTVFPGLIISSFNNTSNVFGLQPGTNADLILYYTDLDSDGQPFNGEVILDGGSLPYFNNVTSDRSASEFSEVVDLETEYNPNKRIVQSGVGLVTRLDLSGIGTFAENNPSSIVNLAEIEIGPIDDNIDGSSPPVALFLYITDERNSIIRDRETFRSIQEDGASFLDRAFPAVLLFDEATRTYKASITSYVQAYASGNYERDQVFMYPVDMTTTLSTFTLDPSTIKLNIFYSEIR